MIYQSQPPERKELDERRGSMVVEFGANWCGICKAAQPLIAEGLVSDPYVSHLMIEDGPGRPLGRSFAVILWPTLVFMKDGCELARVVRPTNVEEIREGLIAIARAVP